MFRLSDLVVLELLDSQAIDININSNRLYCYEVEENRKVNKQLLFDDSYPIKQLTREYSLSVNMNNTLLGTDNFYPELGLGIQYFHKNSEIHKLLNVSTLPLVEFRKAKLYFGQGLLSDPNIIGHWLRVYVILEDDSQVTLASIVDFKNDTNILATPAKLYDNQIFNEALDLEFIDIDYIFNSNNTELIKSNIFGGKQPKAYMFQYSSFTNEGVDDFTENGYVFTSVNFNLINEQKADIDVFGDDLFAILTNNNYYISSELKHQTFNVESYLNNNKQFNETYQISHEFNVEEYNSSGVLINTSLETLINNRDIYKQVNYRPIISENCDHANINVTIKIKNLSTSMIIRRETSILITNEFINNYKAKPNINLNVTSEKINKVVNRNVSKVYQSNEVPDIIHIEKRIFLISQPLEDIELLPSDFVLRINLNEDITGFKKLYIKIGDLTFENLKEGEPIFEISEKAYNQKNKKYVLVDENMKAISTGNIILI